ncbi:MAG: sugar-binding transcriptional regulator [Actinomycetes bacterium]
MSPRPPARAAASPEHLRLLAKVARLYFESGLKQREICEALHISQPRVSRLLKEAQERGIVRSIVEVPEGLHIDLEERIARAYGLTDVMIVDGDDGRSDTTAALGGATAAYLEATLTGGDVLGISTWSSTLLAAVDRMRVRTSPVAERVIQMFGGVGNPDVQMEATRLTSRLAELTGARPVFMPCAAVVSDPSIASALSKDAGVRTVVEQWRDITVSLVGIGSLEPSPLLARSGNAIGSTELDDLRARGAVGDIALRYFRADGREISTDLDARVIGMTGAQLRSVPRRIAVAGGAHKAAAIRAALLGGWATVLITDTRVAAELLDQ